MLAYLRHYDAAMKRISRRQMLKLSAVASTSFVLAPASAPGRPRRPERQGSMLQRPIPSSGERIPAVGLGTARTFNVGRGAGERAPLRAVLHRFVEMGGTVVDTAPVYGRSEPVLGGLIRDLKIRDRLFLATKVSTDGGREAGIRQMEGSFRDLHTDRVDLMQVHNLRGVDVQLPTLRAWKDAGRIRYVGVTTSFRGQFDQMAALMERERLDFVQVNYNIGAREAEDRLLPLAADRGMAILVNEPFERGRLFRAVRGRTLPDWVTQLDIRSWAQLFLKYILSHPAVTCAIPATSDPAHLEDNMGAGYGRLPDAGTRTRMARLFEQL